MAPTPWVFLLDLLREHQTRIPLNSLRRIHTLPQLASMNSEAPKIGGVLYFFEYVAREHLLAPPEVLCTAIPFLRRSDYLLARIASHPYTDVVALRDVYDILRIPRVEIRVEKAPELRWDPQDPKTPFPFQNSGCSYCLCRGCRCADCGQARARVAHDPWSYLRSTGTQATRFGTPDRSRSWLPYSVTHKQ